MSRCYVRVLVSRAAAAWHACLGDRHGSTRVHFSLCFVMVAVQRVETRREAGMLSVKSLSYCILKLNELGTRHNYYSFPSLLPPRPNPRSNHTHPLTIHRRTDDYIPIQPRPKYHRRGTSFTRRPGTHAIYGHNTMEVKKKISRHKCVHMDIGSAAANQYHGNINCFRVGV